MLETRRRKWERQPCWMRGVSGLICILANSILSCWCGCLSQGQPHENVPCTVVQGTVLGKGLPLDLQFCCSHLEIVNFWAKCPTFPFCPASCVGSSLAFLWMLFNSIGNPFFIKHLSLKETGKEPPLPLPMPVIIPNASSELCMPSLSLGKHETAAPESLYVSHWN